MDPRAIVATQFLLNLTSYLLIAQLYVWPRLRSLPASSALQPFVAVHLIRTLGLFAMVPVIAGPGVAETEWARHVAMGDAASVVMAVVTLVLLRHNPRAGVVTAWVLSVVGILDILNAGRNAVAERIMDRAGGQVVVIAFGVPALIVAHVFMLRLLLRRGSAPPVTVADPPRARGAP